jgi:hypothetical protein
LEREGSGGDQGPIVRFYRGEAPDAYGRTLDGILQQDDEWLEREHDFIQWLFPLKVPSSVTPEAPLVGECEQRAFASDPLLRSNLMRAFERMLAFYGFRLQRDSTGTPASVQRTAEFTVQSANWLTRNKHNHLRLTRILRSLRLLGLQQESSLLYAALTAIRDDEGGRSISQATRDFWRRAVES